ncbi:colicin immunity protein [Trinickia fusca]|uniref:Colicin immunity protein n=2 Tax=Trinickia fusca TaxID=2419777 RepID=A0A494WXK1_9BURK|nr:colicin immunity protein [Trinickia fusca]
MRYEEAEDFFALQGSIVMKLTTEAAIGVCEQAAQRGLLVSRIEGGIWHNPGFEARIDCIWDGGDPPLDVQAAHENNLAAIEFIRSELPEHDAFIITSLPIAGRV